jgi:hypothetical protein
MGMSAKLNILTFATVDDVVAEIVFAVVPALMFGNPITAFHVFHRELAAGLQVFGCHFDAQLVVGQVAPEDGEVTDKMVHLRRIEGGGFAGRAWFSADRLDGSPDQSTASATYAPVSV